MGWLFRYVSRPVETETELPAWALVVAFVAIVVVCGFLDGAA
jgi:hypothetical protein